MKSRSAGLFLLSIYLIGEGVVTLGGISLGPFRVILPVLAIAAGVCLLVGR